MAHAILERLPMTMGYFRLIHRCFGRANSAALLEGTGVSERDLSNPSAEITLFQQVRQIENVTALRGPGWALSQPELWNPVTGEMLDLPDFETSHGKTIVPLKFAAAQSWFVSFVGRFPVPIILRVQKTSRRSRS